MQQKNSMKQSRRRKTRNQRKRELIQTACMAFALVLLSMMLCVGLVKAWAAEQPVTYAEHMEAIGGDPYGNLQD